MRSLRSTGGVVFAGLFNGVLRCVQRRSLRLSREHCYVPRIVLPPSRVGQGHLRGRSRKLLDVSPRLAAQTAWLNSAPAPGLCTHTPHPS